MHPVASFPGAADFPRFVPPDRIVIVPRTHNGVSRFRAGWYPRLPPGWRPGNNLPTGQSAVSPISADTGPGGSQVEPEGPPRAQGSGNLMSPQHQVAPALNFRSASASGGRPAVNGQDGGIRHFPLLAVRRYNLGMAPSQAGDPAAELVPPGGAKPYNAAHGTGGTGKVGGNGTAASLGHASLGIGQLGPAIIRRRSVARRGFGRTFEKRSCHYHR